MNNTLKYYNEKLNELRTQRELLLNNPKLTSEYREVCKKIQEYRLKLKCLR